MISSIYQAAWIAVLAFVVALFTLVALKNSAPRLSHQEAQAGGQLRKSSGEHHTPNGTPPAHTKPETDQGPSGPESTKNEKESTDAALATYTYYLTFFTAVLAVATVILAVATIGLWNYAAEQAGDMKESIAEARRGSRAAEAAAKVARETLEASQRPFIFIRRYEANVLGALIRVGVIFENSGSSPTRNMRSRINWKWFPGEPPADFAYPDVDSHGNVDHTVEERPAFVGPKATTPSAQLDIPTAWVDRVRNNDGRIFFYGWVEYDDLLPESPRHRTEFCNELAILGIGPDEHNPAAVKAAVSFPLYGKHNSAN